jgi:hypothetical protein
MKSVGAASAKPMAKTRVRATQQIQTKGDNALQ